MTERPLPSFLTREAAEADGRGRSFEMPSRPIAVMVAAALLLLQILWSADVIMIGLRSFESFRAASLINRVNPSSSRDLGQAHVETAADRAAAEYTANLWVTVIIAFAVLMAVVCVALAVAVFRGSEAGQLSAYLVCGRTVIGYAYVGWLCAGMQFPEAWFRTAAVVFASAAVVTHAATIVLLRTRAADHYFHPNKARAFQANQARPGGSAQSSAGSSLSPASFS